MACHGHNSDKQSLPFLLPPKVGSACSDKLEVSKIGKRLGQVLLVQ